MQSNDSITVRLLYLLSLPVAIIMSLLYRILVRAPIACYLKAKLSNPGNSAFADVLIREFRGGHSISCGSYKCSS